MSVQYNVVITSNDNMAEALKLDTLAPKESIETISLYMDKLAIGCGAASVDMQKDATGTAASGTITFTSLANNDTITVGGIVFTAKTSGASGAAQFNLGADDTAAAANAVLKINTHTSLTGVVTATSALGVITVSGAKKLKMGNMVTLAISADGSVSGARLTGGVDPTSNVMHCGL